MSATNTGSKRKFAVEETTSVKLVTKRNILISGMSVPGNRPPGQNQTGIAVRLMGVKITIPDQQEGMERGPGLLDIEVNNEQGCITVTSGGLQRLYFMRLEKCDCDPDARSIYLKDSDGGGAILMKVANDDTFGEAVRNLRLYAEAQERTDSSNHAAYPDPNRILELVRQNNTTLQLFGATAAASHQLGTEILQLMSGQNRPRLQVRCVRGQLPAGPN